MKTTLAIVGGVLLLAGAVLTPLLLKEKPRESPANIVEPKFEAPEILATLPNCGPGEHEVIVPFQVLYTTSPGGGFYWSTTDDAPPGLSSDQRKRVDALIKQIQDIAKEVHP